MLEVSIVGQGDTKMAYKHKIKTALLDAGGILFDDSQKDLFYKFLKAKVGVISPNFFKENFPVYLKYRTKAQTQRGYGMMDAYRDCLNDMGLGKYYGEFMNYFNKNKNNQLKIYPEGKELVKSLREQGIEPIVLSDNSSYGEKLEEKLRKGGINVKVITSKDVGKIKPANYNLVIERYNLDKDEMILVAHDKDELEGASHDGIKAIEFYPSKKIIRSNPYNNCGPTAKKAIDDVISKVVTSRGGLPRKGGYFWNAFKIEKKKKQEY